MGGDPAAPTTGESTEQVLQAYIKYLAPLTQQTNQQILPTEQALQDAKARIAPQEQQLNYDLYSKFGPQFANAAAGTELAAIQGKGGEAVREADRLNRSIDPEYYSGRAATGKSLSELLGGMDPNQLTDVEMANTERGLNRMNARGGNLNTPQSGSNTLRAALTFDDRLQQKRSNVAQAIAAASQALPTLRSGADTFSQATGRAGTQAFQSGQSFTGGQGFGQNALQSGQALQKNLFDTQNNAANINANRRDTLDRVNENLSSLPT